MRLIGEHVIVQRFDFNPMRAQSADHWIDLSGKQNKVAGNCCLASACWLKVDSSSSTHCGWDLHRSLSDLLGAGHGELQNAAIDFSLVTERLLDLCGVQVDGRLRGRWRCCCRRGSLRQRKGRCDGTRQHNRVAMPFDVHIKYARRFTQKVVMKGSLLDAFLLKLQH